ncbi:MAG: metallophosphoesterase [Bryobacterales bacterium]|nr:metallophosphoesterase [Bryobacterales bacterium]
MGLFILRTHRIGVDLAAILLGALIQYLLCRLVWRSITLSGYPALHRAAKILALVSFAWVILSLSLGGPALGTILPNRPFITMLRGAGIAWGIMSLGIVLALGLLHLFPPHNPQRRRLLLTVRAAVVAAPSLATGYGTFVERTAFSVHETPIRIPGLPKDLDGLRLVQLTDIHLSPFLSERDLARVVDMANETRAHVALVTGDLITAAGDPLAAAIRQVARLKSDAGIWGCLGNHEIYADCEDEATRLGLAAGVHFLRQQARLLRFGNATLNLAGVDYQRSSHQYLVGAGSLKANNAFNLLLSHNPDVFPVAAQQQWDLMLSGHTHGGQITVEILGSPITLVRLFTPYIRGVYHLDNSVAFVSRGIGTVGVPTRVGAPPEVSLIRLCAI